MTVETFQLLFAILALASFAAVIGVVVVESIPRFSDIADDIAERAAALTLLVAVVATAGSLYLSEVANYEPCKFCWYQRVAMYPLVVILAVAVLRRSRDFEWFVLPLAVGGGLISLYHLALQRLPALDSGSCAIDVPCSGIYVEEFGFVTIPVMAFAGFLLISTLMVMSLRRNKE